VRASRFCVAPGYRVANEVHDRIWAMVALGQLPLHLRIYPGRLAEIPEVSQTPFPRKALPRLSRRYGPEEAGSPCADSAA
jgi:hypothetical protein